MDKLEQRKKLINMIIDYCYSHTKITNKNDACIMGYCVELAYRVAIFEDGTIWTGFIGRRNNDAQWQADKLVREAIKEIKETL